MTADLLADLHARGLVQDSTDLGALAARLAPDHPSGPLTLYAGFDPSVDSLHVGNLQQILVLRRFQDAGHRPLALAGGATGMIGDPGGRSEERELLDIETLDRNLVGIKAQLSRFLVFGPGANGADLVDNRTWTESVSLLDFLRDVGKHVTVNQMAARESVKARLESEHGISYTEFSYMLLQAHDYWWLNEFRGCELQVGGSDQWGNILAGVDLIRRRSQRTVHALTTPLVTDSAGVKFGKSTGGGNTWLDPARTSPYQLFQFFVQVDDGLVDTLLRRLTLLPVAEVTSVMEGHRDSPERRGAQRLLAQEVTALVHGRAAAAAAERASEVLFTGGLGDIDQATLDTVAGEVPGHRVGRSDLDASIDLVDILVASGLTGSRGEARRAISQGGVYINGAKVAEGRHLGPADLLHGRHVLIRRGKRDHRLVVVEN